MSKSSPEHPLDTPDRRPGPKRAEGAPVGPDAVREAVLEAAAALFAEFGVAHVSLRDIAGSADVQLSLIGRYVGTRDELIEAVFRSVNDTVACELRDRPLQQLAYGRDSPISRWLALLTYYSEVGVRPPMDGANPIRALADVFEEHLGLDHRSARVRAVQVAAITAGWRRFEAYLVASAELEDLDGEPLRDDLTAIQRLIGSTPWPTRPVG